MSAIHWLAHDQVIYDLFCFQRADCVLPRSVKVVVIALGYHWVTMFTVRRKSLQAR